MLEQTDDHIVGLATENRALREVLSLVKINSSASIGSLISNRMAIPLQVIAQIRSGIVRNGTSETETSRCHLLSGVLSPPEGVRRSNMTTSTDTENRDSDWHYGPASIATVTHSPLPTVVRNNCSRRGVLGTTTNSDRNGPVFFSTVPAYTQIATEVGLHVE